MTDKNNEWNFAPVDNCQFGCGMMMANGYLNVDFLDYMFNGEIKTGMVYHVPAKGDRCFFVKLDVAEGVPFPDEQFSHVYHSHFLEHINNVQGFGFLQHCYRILKPGGRMRILVPDLEYWSDAYLNNREPFLHWYRDTWLKDPVFYKTKAQIFMGALHNHGHQMGYDFETLTHILSHIGFEKIVKTPYAQSNFPEISYLEAPDARSYESVCVECAKPQKIVDIHTETA